MSEIIRERNDATRCFSTIRLDSGDIVMVSIAGAEGKIFRMAAGGTVPTETLWKVDDVSRLPESFTRLGVAVSHPLDLIRAAVLMCRDVSAVRGLPGSTDVPGARPQPSNRHVPLTCGVGAMGLAVWLLLGGAEGWSRIVSLILFLFGAFSLRLALFGNDREIREVATTTDE